MENRTINIAEVAEVAEALKDIKQDMVFVGGAVVSLYTDDPAADEIRPTQDIDMSLKYYQSQSLGKGSGKIRYAWLSSRSIWSCHLQV